MSRNTQRRLGFSIAWLALATGIAASIAVGVIWSSESRDHAAQGFATEAAVISSSVRDGITRMNDLTVGARAKIASDSRVTNAELADWYESVDGSRRYPGALGFGYAEVVPAAQLSSYVSAARADPAPGIEPLRRFVLVPPGRRASYCLIRLAVAGKINRLLPGYGYDLCRVPGFDALQISRDSGHLTTVSGRLADGTRVLIVTAPVYWAARTPGTLHERRSQARGWVVGVFDVSSVLAAAVGGARGIGLSLATAAGPVAAWGHPETGASVMTRRFPIRAAGRWSVTVSEVQHSGLFSPTVQGIMVAGVGILVSLMAFALAQLLMRGRARALQMVDEKTDQLRHQALHDALTGLPNRVLIVDRAQQMLRRSRRRSTPVAALFLDLDGFKNVNDTFGHPAGDELLRSVAERIAASLRDTDTVGRLGGDEFVVLIEGDSLLGGAELVAERLLDVIREPFTLGPADEFTLSATASIGIATGDRTSASDLLRDADIALYEAKAAGKDQYAVFRQEMQAAVHDRVELEIDLRAGIEHEELFLEYQPIVDLDDGRLTRVEALIRWRHPVRGVLQPADFIPVAEDTGLVVPIGRWVLENACRQVACWRADGHDIDVAINISPRQLTDAALVGTVGAALAASGLDPTALILEITETALMHNAEQTVSKLVQLRALGLRIAIDDFGTGYSSLAYLQQFPIDSLKIDRSFVAGITRSAHSKALIHTLVQLGKALNLTTIAEGNEQPAELAHLRTEACDKGQGFLFAEPLPADELGLLLDKGRDDAPARANVPRDRPLPIARPQPRAAQA